VLDEQEVGGLAVAGMRQRPLVPSLGGPGVQRRQGCLVQRDGALAGELAEGDLEPAAVAGEVEQAVQLEVEQFAQAQSGATQNRQPVPGEGVGELGDGGHQLSVVVGGQCAGQRPVQPGDVTGI